ncbi:hypothetical protein Bca4012_097303 [Brassica carinata]
MFLDTITKNTITPIVTFFPTTISPLHTTIVFDWMVKNKKTVDGFTSLTGFHHHHHCGGERRREEIEVAMELCEGDLRRGRERRRRRGRCRGGDVNGVEGDEAHT